jgi:cyanophycinase
MLRILLFSISLLLLAPQTTWSQDKVGSLLIAGGGNLPDSIYAKFVELAGGTDGHIVIVPTAASDEDLDSKEDLQWYLDSWGAWGLKSITIRHTRDHAEANSEEFCRIFETATGVWFGGGDQTRIADAYLGTLSEKAIMGVFMRGGCIGGTSAGAAIQSRVMICGGEAEPTLGTGLDLLPNGIVDQHFLARNRIMRLMRAIEQHPDRIGVGIDEQTAIVVRGKRAEVVGNSYAVVMKMEGPTRGLEIHSVAAGGSFVVPGS